MALIGSVNNQGSLQGQINTANGYLTGVISDAELLGGQVVGMRGLKGDKGDKGDTGAAGADGHSPVVTASKTDDTTTVYVDGSPIATILDGEDGADGFSPSASVSKVGDTATITITDKDGTTTASISDGDINVQSDWNEADTTADDYIKNKPAIPSATSTTPKMDGTASVGSEATWAKGDHVHPTDTSRAASSHTHTKSDVTDFSHTHTKSDVTDFSHTHTKSDVTDFSHTHTKSEITDFPSLATVATSGSYTDLSNKPDIHNVPSGGTSGQVLSKDSNDDYDLAWTTVASGGGEIVYCTCTDSASTVAKTATIVKGSLDSLETGSQVAVKFTYTNTATNPTLNVNSTGAKAIMRGGTAHVGTNANESWNAGTVVYMLYDGSVWNIVGWLNTTYTGGTEYEIVAGTVALNKVWSPQQIHNGINSMATATPTASKNSKFDASAHMNSTDMTTGSGSELEDFIDGLNVSGGSAFLDMFYPVGSYYETSDATFDPNVKWGGTWIPELEGQVHVSAGTNYPVSGALTNTNDDGSKDAVVVKHNHTQNSHNHTQNAHHHTAFKYKTGQLPTGSSGAVRVWDWSHSGDTVADTSDTTATNIATTATNQESGVDGTNKNMMPYIVVYRWHRTA